MEKIKLLNPAVVYVPIDTSTEDVSVIADMVEYKKCINLTEGTVHVADIKEEEKNAIVGVDAARVYCLLHQIPFRVIEEIDVDDIVKHCEDMEDLIDIMLLIGRVYLCNEELRAMMEIESSETVKRAGRLKLQLAVENLASNCHSSKPVKHYDGELLSSLSCIGYHIKTREVEE